ncbi:integrase [Comamonas sp. wu1-DMT]|uniref:integrase n=1 Tax=Comamonas sp. wu1-DMT TaxID=3126390 RepID=UPI0032E3DC70
MSNLVLFKPRRELSAEKNLAAFVAMCRDELTALGADLPFDEMKWDVTNHIKLKGKNGALRAVFSTWESADDSEPTPMAEPYAAFAKSYFRYQHAFCPTKSIGSRLAATRALGAALAEHGSHDVTLVHGQVLNRAAQLIAVHYGKDTAYRTGQQLEMLASFIDDNRLASVPLRWVNPIERPVQTAGRVGEEFEARRQEMLPSPFALDALARAFRAASETPDVVVTSVAAIMCSAPDRVNEVLRLQTGCEVHSSRQEAPEAYGLRFWPSKGADPMVKWVVPSMSSVVQEAIRRLQGTSSEARQVARWYEDNPSVMYLPSHLEHLRGKDLFMDELGEVLFAEPVSRTSPGQWCTGNKVPTFSVGKKKAVKFSDVEAAILGELPRGFPWLDADIGLRYSEALCLVRRNELHKSRTTFRGIVEAVDQNFIATGLGNRSEHGFKSVFENLGLFEADGSPIAIRTHQFRHYLNTLAQAGGLSELDIAKWSGRKDIRQNEAYNHVSDRDVQARIVELKREVEESSSTDLVPQVRISLLPRSEFKKLGIKAAHTTDFGMCVHDFVMSPCPIHQDCNNCNEQVCIKGDKVGEANARAAHEETASLLEAAKEADADGEYGASRWVQHQTLTHSRLSELIAILDNPRVPEGALIRLTHVEQASRLQHAVKARAALENKSDEPRLLKWIVVEEGATE